MPKNATMFYATEYFYYGFFFPQDEVSFGLPETKRGTAA